MDWRARWDALPPRWQARSTTASGFCLIVLALGGLWLVAPEVFADGDGVVQGLLVAVAFLFGVLAGARGLALVLVASFILAIGTIAALEANADYQDCRSSGAIHCESGVVELGVAAALVVGLAATAAGGALGSRLRNRSRAR